MVVNKLSKSNFSPFGYVSIINCAVSNLSKYNTQQSFCNLDPTNLTELHKVSNKTYCLV